MRKVLTAFFSSERSLVTVHRFGFGGMSIFDKIKTYTLTFQNYIYN